jgi:hypothetical protein
MGTKELFFLLIVCNHYIFFKNIIIDVIVCNVYYFEKGGC